MSRTLSCVIVLGAVCAATAPARSAVIVSFQPPVVNVEVGQTATIDLVAMIPLDTPVIGWGLHVSLDNAAVLQFPGTGTLNIADWFPAGMNAVFDVNTPSDRIAAVAFPTPKVGFVTLATFSFVATAQGMTMIEAYDNRLLNPLMPDNTEGFALVPPKGFAQVTYVPGRINVPTPGGTIIAAAGCVVWIARRRRQILV